MMGERTEHRIPPEVAVKIANAEVQLRITSPDDLRAIPIEVDDITSKAQIAHESKVALERKYWFANDQWEQEELKERVRVRLGEHATDIFVFGEKISEERLESITRTLQRFYNRLRDKRLWNLESIQVIPRKKDINTKSNEPFRGMEFPDQHRLELYAAGLESSAYRGGELPCTELEGTLVHEMTHVVLEPALAEAWQSEDLGWKIANDELIELPGGDRTAFYNERPQECPTSYGALQQDDDRADSVVAYLFWPEQLHETRKRILERFLTDEDTESQVETNKLAPSLPHLPSEVAIAVIEKMTDLFGVASIKAGKDKKVVSLSELRKAKSIPEPKF